MLALALALALAGGAAHAQNYPQRTVRIVIPFSAGGATDVPGRILAQKLSEAFGQQFIVDNRPGAGSSIGAELVAKSPPDGHTLLLTASTHAISAGLYRKLPYDALRDFAPIMLVGSGPNVLVVHPSLPARTVKELISLARAQPGRIDHASSGNGSAQHLFGALFTSMAGIKMTHIPYKGSGPAMADLMGGQVSVGFPGIALALPHTRAGRLRPLGQTSAKRSGQMPEVPTIDEAGVKGYEATLWLGLMAPRGTPPEIVKRLHGEVSRIMKQPEVEASFVSTGTDVTLSTPEQFAAFLKSELDKWAKVIREVGAQVN